MWYSLTGTHQELGITASAIIAWLGMVYLLEQCEEPSQHEPTRRVLLRAPTARGVLTLPRFN